MGCATTTVKISTIIFNIVLAALGIAGLIWIAYNSDSFSTEFTIAYYVISSLIILLAVLGCVAALRESIWLAGVCAVFLLILAILQTVATCLEIFSQEPHNALTVVADAWDKNNMDDLQIAHACCGKDSAQDYVLLGKPLPASCYAGQEVNVPSKLFLDGCSSKLRDFYDNKEIRLIIVSCLLIGFELIGFLLSVFLVNNLRNKQRRMNF